MFERVGLDGVDRRLGEIYVVLCLVFFPAFHLSFPDAEPGVGANRRGVGRSTLSFGGMRIHPTNQTLALSVSAIVIVIIFRIVTGVQHYLIVRQHDPTIWDSPSTGVAWLLCLSSATVLGWWYCIRATIAALRSQPVLPRTGIVLCVAWAVALTPALVIIAVFAQWNWLGWSVALW